MPINYFAAPGFYDDMTYKLSHKGITKLINRAFKSRVSGSRTHIVLPDGTLVDNRTRDKLKGPLELQREQNRRPRKKTDQVPETVGKAEKPVRRYYVNEKIISARVFSYIQAMRKPVLHFITISFPPMVTDDQGYQYLNTWLTVAKKYCGLKDYLFVAERQEIGTVHFHLMVPQYINITKLNRAMSVILRNEARKNKLPGYSIFQAKRYNGVDMAKERDKKTGKRTGPVINFADPRRRKTLVGYITKYVSKGKKPKEENEQSGFAHLAWHNSRGFSSVFTGVSLTPAEKDLNGFGLMVNRVREFKSEFFRWCPWSANHPPNLFTTLLRIANRAVQDGKNTFKLIHSL